MKSLIALLLFASGTAVAADCAPMNLISEPNSPFKKIPVYDQDGAGTCYSYVASVLANYHLLKNGETTLKVHPHWAALKFAESEKRAELRGGFSDLALKAIMESGNCSYDLAIKGIANWAKKNSVSEEKIIALIESYAKKASGEKRKSVRDQLFTKALKEESFVCAENWTGVFPEVTALEFLGAPQLFSRLLFKECNEKLEPLSLPKPKFVEGMNDQGFKDELNRKLSALRAPIGISFCSGVLENPSFKGISRRLEGQKYKLDYNKGCGDHEAAIVGRKEVNGQCHYLLRNSWGSNYSSKTSEWKCFCKDKRTGQFIDDCTNKSKNSYQYSFEGCWIPENSLIPNTFGLTTLEQQ